MFKKHFKIYLMKSFSEIERLIWFEKYMFIHVALATIFKMLTSIIMTKRPVLK